MSARLRLAYDTVAIDVEAETDTPLTWLLEFLAPAFERVSSERGAADHRVVFVTTPAAHAARKAALESASLRTLDCFTRDGSFARHPAWKGENGRVWAHDERAHVFVGVDEGGRSVSVVAGCDESLPRVALMRVVRELATRGLHRAGRLPIHAAAFLLDDRAVLLCGPKRAGKTSLLVHALRCGGAFLANDRLWMTARVPATVRAMPTIVMLRNGTLAHFEALERAYEDASFDRGRTISECAPGIERVAPRARRGFDRPGISPAQLCHLLDAPMVPAAAAGALVFPVIDPSEDGLRLEVLPAHLATRALVNSLLKASYRARTPELFGADPGIAPAAETAQCRLLVEQVPAFTCRLGPNAYGVDVCEALREAARSSLAP